jgi:ABC-type sugar transport system substrate-binding protein
MSHPFTAYASSMAFFPAMRPNSSARSIATAFGTLPSKCPVISPAAKSPRIGPSASLTSSRAFRDAAAEYPGIRIVGSCIGRYLLEAARAAIAGLLAALPHIDAILAANDIMAIGAIEALSSVGCRAHTLKCLSVLVLRAR